jgi:hypothetical protein
MKQRYRAQPSLTTILQLWQRTAGCCGICGEPLDPADATIDRLLPVRRGSTAVPAHLQIAHRQCHAVQGATVGFTRGRPGRPVRFRLRSRLSKRPACKKAAGVVVRTKRATHSDWGNGRADVAAQCLRRIQQTDPRRDLRLPYQSGRLVALLEAALATLDPLSVSPQLSAAAERALDTVFRLAEKRAFWLGYHQQHADLATRLKTE